MSETHCAPRLVRAIRVGLPAAFVVAFGLAASGATAANQVADGSSSRDVMEQARGEIPWAKLSRQDQRLTQYVVRKASLFRRSPTHAFDCDPQVFNFLSQHPEVVVNVWNLMGVSKLSLTRHAEDRFHAEDGAGAEGALRVMHADYQPDSRNTVVVFADGQYQAGPMPEPIDAHCVLVLRSASRRESDGRDYVTARLDSFVRFEHVGTELIAKTLKPLLVKSADHNFTETMKFVSTFSRTAEQRPDGLLNLAQRLDKVDDKTREELAVLCRETAARHASVDPAAGPIRLARLQQPEEVAGR
ncbi:hypothetical protein [Posidoniimonas corsicana]|uniref:hypothetical protein n=1 Tax=Posidoniimonas corsicana TaxID=1938618 RepID=UPI0011B4DBE7|nr:hypothetical protein [Posidoniimonas corsicana]